jgi:predicted DNA-binding transcriptional regulator AlpA
VNASLESPHSLASAALMDVDAVAAMLDCSARHVCRLTHDGEMPQPVKLRALTRWRRAEIEHWLDDGCPPVRIAEPALTGEGAR